MSKLIMTLIAALALAVAACGPAGDPGTPGDPLLDTPAPLVPGDPGGSPATDPFDPGMTP